MLNWSAHDRRESLKQPASLLRNRTNVASRARHGPMIELRKTACRLRYSMSFDLFMFFVGASRWGEELKARGTVLFALSALGTAGAAAMASETITYSYDSRGRLVKVERTGDVNNNVKAEYKYDKADNRTNVNVTSPNSPPS